MEDRDLMGGDDLTAVDDVSNDGAEFNFTENFDVQDVTILEEETKLPKIDIDSGNEELSLSNEERTIHELETLLTSMDWSDRHAEIEQIAGSYGDIKGSEINGKVGEAHHIIPQSIVDFDKGLEIAIELEKQDHRDLPSTGGSINSKYESFIPEDTAGEISHKNAIKELIDQGEYAEAFRNELLEIRKNEYDKSVADFKENHPGQEPTWDDLNFGKYDAASKAAIEQEIAFIREFGVPNTK